MTDPRLSFVESVASEGHEALFQRLERTRVEIVAAPETVVTFAGQVLVYQIATLASRLFDQVAISIDEETLVHSRLGFLGLTEEHRFAMVLRDTLAAIRPRPDSRERAPQSSVIRVLVGQPLSSTDAVDHFDLFVGCTGWCALLSVVNPLPVSALTLSVGALAAGALAASEIFKYVFRDVLRGTLMLEPNGREAYSLSLLTFGDTSDEPEPELPDDIDIDITLFGCGSIGCAAMLGILVTPQFRGSVTTVDNGSFDERNPYKYVLLDSASASAKVAKAQWARNLLAGATADRLHVVSFEGTAAEYVASLPADYTMPLALSAVDTLDARFEIQDTMPKRIVNAGIDATVAEVSVHGFGEGPCLACLGVGRTRESWNAKPIADRVGLSEERVHKLILGNGPLEAADIEVIIASNTAPAELLADVASFQGQPILSFYNRVLYSEAAIVTASGMRARVTTAFVSAFAGALILAEVIKESIGNLHRFRVDNSYRQDLLGIPADGQLRYTRDATGWCACHSGFRQMVYRRKYSE